MIDLVKALGDENTATSNGETPPGGRAELFSSVPIDITGLQHSQRCEMSNGTLGEHGGLSDSL